MGVEMKTIRNTSIRRAQGFALIEVLVSVALFTIGILGLVALQARGVQFSTDSEDRNNAALLANDLATMMWTYKSVDYTASPLKASYQSWLDNRVKAVAPQCSPTCLPNGNATIALNVDAVTKAQVAVITITWRAPSKGASESDSRYVTEVMVQ